MQSTSALNLELPEEAGGESPPDGAEGGGDNDEGDDDAMEDEPEEVLPRPSALKAVYARGGGEHFLLAMGGWARGAIFECSWEVRVWLMSRFEFPSEARVLCPNWFLP